MAVPGQIRPQNFYLTHHQTPTLTKLPPKPPIANTGKEVKLTLNTFPVLELPKAIVWQYDVSRNTETMSTFVQVQANQRYP